MTSRFAILLCALSLPKDYDEAIRFAQDLAIRNPDVTAYQILVAQILAERPGAEDEALERIKNIPRLYKITSDDELSSQLRSKWQRNVRCPSEFRSLRCEQPCHSFTTEKSSYRKQSVTSGKRVYRS
jgi:hypothetical protein